MKRVRFLMIGGFLGAGKTTAIARLARHYLDRGLRVGVVTNDQAYGLVDTQSLRAQGFDVGEVTGACFCCKFNDLVATAAGLAAEAQPDVILAEPVGSCTDLVATVIEPLEQLYGDRYEVGPLAVLLKPEHGQKILAGQQNVGFSAKAAYIFLKQLEEADLIVINKTDKLARGERDRLVAAASQRMPGKTVLTLSARHGDGFEALIAALDMKSPASRRAAEVDYDIYAAGEAELGWLNCTVEMRSSDGRARFSLDDLVVEFVRRLARACAAEGAEPAHLKVLGDGREGATAIANLVSSDGGIELSMSSAAQVAAATLTVNARVAIDPATLTRIVETEADALAKAQNLIVAVSELQSFRPGRPVPTHRMSPSSP